MRVFLDTNVLVSAVATRGICADILTLVLAEHQLVLGEQVLTELKRILVKKMKVSMEIAEEADIFLRGQAAVVSSAEPHDIMIRDEDDIIVLGEAIAALADVLVSGDKDLTAVAEEAPLQILTPRGFWESLHG